MQVVALHPAGGVAPKSQPLLARQDAVTARCGPRSATQGRGQDQPASSVHVAEQPSPAVAFPVVAFFVKLRVNATVAAAGFGCWVAARVAAGLHHDHPRCHPDHRWRPDCPCRPCRPRRGSLRCRPSLRWSRRSRWGRRAALTLAPPLCRRIATTAPRWKAEAPIVGGVRFSFSRCRILRNGACQSFPSGLVGFWAA